MLTKTWSYGTEIIATVELSEWRGNVSLVICIDNNREGYVMVGCRHEIMPEVGERVVIRFVKEGPTRGSWKVIRRV